MLEFRRKGFFKRNWGVVSSLASFFFDLVLLNFSFGLSLWIHFGNIQDLQNYVKPLLFVNVLFIFMSVGLGIYRARYNFSTKNLSFQYKLLVLYLTISTMAFLFITNGQDYSRQAVIFAFLIMLVCFELFFRIFAKLQDYLAKKNLLSFRTIIIGTDYLTLEFSQQLRAVFGHFFQIIGYVINQKEKTPSVDKNLEPFIIGDETGLEDLISAHQPDIVFISSKNMDIDKYRETYQICRKKMLKLKIVSRK